MMYINGHVKKIIFIGKIMLTSYQQVETYFGDRQGHKYRLVFFQKNMTLLENNKII